MVNSAGLRRSLTGDTAASPSGTVRNSPDVPTGPIDVLPVRRRSVWGLTGRETPARGRHQARDDVHDPLLDLPPFPRVPAQRLPVREGGFRGIEVEDLSPGGSGLLEPSAGTAFQEPPRMSQIRGLPPQGAPFPGPRAQVPPAAVPEPEPALPRRPAGSAPEVPAPRGPAGNAAGSADPWQRVPATATGEMPGPPAAAVSAVRDLRAPVRIGQAPFGDPAGTSPVRDLRAPLTGSRRREPPTAGAAGRLPSNEVLPSRVPPRWGLRDRALDLADRARNAFGMGRDEEDEYYLG